jgi:nucleoside phosphorylase
MMTTAEVHHPMTDALAARGARPCCVATTLAITVDDAAAARIAKSADADVEHLEAQGVAAACAVRGVPFAAVLGVANLVGALGREQWRTHHRHAERVAGERVLQWLREGAVGLPAAAPPNG